jgi:hypothetical protein
VGEQAGNIGEQQGGNVEAQAGVGEQAMEQTETFKVTSSTIAIREYTAVHLCQRILTCLWCYGTIHRRT